MGRIDLRQPGTKRAGALFFIRQLGGGLGSVPGKLLYASTLICILSFAFLNASDAPYQFQDDHQLLPLFLFADGHPVYDDPDVGPIYNTIYPPLSFLAYFPALLFRTPGPAIFSARLMAQIFTVAPILWLLWLCSPRSPAARPATCILIVVSLWAISASSVLNKMTDLHADAPALGLSFCACILTWRVMERPSWRTMVLLALCCALATWAKQSAAAIVLVPILMLLLSRRWRPLAAFVGVYIALQALAGGFFLLLFRNQQFVFWLFDMPARHMRNVGNARILVTLETAVSAMPVLLLATLWLMGMMLYRAIRQRRVDAREDSPPNRRLGAIFLLAALIGIPGSILGFAKPGGWLNTFLYFAYFAFIAVLLAIQELVVSWRWVDRWPGRLRLALAAAMIVVGAVTARALHLQLGSALRGNFPQEPKVQYAYEFLRQHPGRIWFPRYPLTSYLAEGKLYHCDMGFFDRRVAGLHIPDEQLQRFLPNGGRVVACGYDCHQVNFALSEYRRIPYPDLRGDWRVYERIPDGPLHLQEKWE